MKIALAIPGAGVLAGLVFERAWQWELGVYAWIVVAGVVLACWAPFAFALWQPRGVDLHTPSWSGRLLAPRGATRHEDETVSFTPRGRVGGDPRFARRFGIPRN